MDCDGQHEPARIPQFLDALGSDVAVASGSRYLPSSGSVGEAPLDRQQINARVTSEINRVTGWSLTDAFCGFKAYRTDALAGLELRESGYAMPLELWARAWRAGLTVSEIPVERIYCDRNRSFGADLDDPERRFDYYMDVWNRALEET
jgi:dolichol-phosphate mannosyltransferase